MTTKRCKCCGELIYGEKKYIQCPDCMNLYHSKCIEERIVEFETSTGRKGKARVNYYRCPNCSKEIQQSNMSNLEKLILKSKYP